MSEILVAPAVTIRLSENELEDCWRFAETVRPTNLACYAQRHQGNIYKIAKDIVYGKLAEIGTAQVLGTPPPDFTVYSVGSKSYVADLETSDGKQVHVKSQTADSAARFGQSWIFQLRDPLVYCPTEADFLALVETRPARLEVTVLNPALLSGQAAQPHYAVPRIYRLRDTKTCLYGDDLRAANLLIGDAAIA